MSRYQFSEPEEVEDCILINNPGSLLVLVNNEHFEKDHQLFLTKVLQSIDIDLATMASVISLDQNFYNISGIIRKKKIERILCLGVSPNQIAVHINEAPYKIIKIGQLEFLFANNLSEISKDQSLKKALWDQLKRWKVQ